MSVAVRKHLLPLANEEDFDAPEGEQDQSRFANALGALAVLAALMSAALLVSVLLSLNAQDRLFTGVRTPSDAYHETSRGIAIALTFIGIAGFWCAVTWKATIGHRASWWTLGALASMQAIDWPALAPAVTSPVDGVSTWSQMIFGIAVFLAAYSRLSFLRRSGALMLPGSAVLLPASLLFFGSLVIQMLSGAVVTWTGSGAITLDASSFEQVIVPSLAPDSLGVENSQRARFSLPPLSEEQIAVHTIHRAGALLTFVGAFCLWITALFSRWTAGLHARRMLTALFGLTVLQALCGFLSTYTLLDSLWASLHVIFGALLFAAALFAIQNLALRR